MNGDFSRNTFDPRHRFSHVLMQQGRVLLDADWNEQTAILLHYLRTLATHVIGPHGTPDGGFRIRALPGAPNDFVIGRGHYYVDGILCENYDQGYCPPRGEEVAGVELLYSQQPDYPLTEKECKRDLEDGRRYLVYLDVWERHLTHIEAGHIREVALGGPDTATRARIVWQVKVREITTDPGGPRCDGLLPRPDRRCMRARARVAEESDDPCIIPPEARYRGAENQLYRVEIHRGGTAADPSRPATWKWSRDNGSVVFGIRSLQGSTARLDNLGPDERRGLHEGDWVEIVDDDSVLKGRPRDLVQVTGVDRVRSEVMLAVPTDSPNFDANGTTHPFLRRWDLGSEAVPVREGKWIELEDGVQVQFVGDGVYRPGDHWLVPARTATGDVLWPIDGTGSPSALEPGGIAHHYAPLAEISVAAGTVEIKTDCRRRFAALAEPFRGEAAEDDAEREASERLAREGEGVRSVTDDRRRAEGENEREPLPAVAGTAGIGAIAALERRPQSASEPHAETVAVAPSTAGPGPASSGEESRAADLTRITHVGPRRAEALIQSGHGTVEAIARMNVADLRDILTIGDRTAEEIVASARTVGTAQL
jgi:predicted flap endonuclease-1-like 5' DNA nuclease